MEVLNQIALNFQFGAEHWATTLVNALEPSFSIFLKLALLLLIIAILCKQDAWLGLLLPGVLFLGFSHFILVEGWVFTQSLFRGVRVIAELLGAPAPNPSAIVAMGATVSDPLLKSVAGQGYLSYLLSANTYIYGFAGTLVFLAFVILALVQMSLLITSSFLVGSAPFFLFWLPLPVVRVLTMGWWRMVTGCMGGLFAVSLVTAVMRDAAQWMTDRYQSQYANATNVTTLTVADFSEPIATALILGFVFAWLPWQVFRAMGGVGVDLATATGRMLSAGAGAAVTVSNATVNAMSSQTSSGSTSGGSGNRGGGSNSSGSMGPVQTPQKGAWSGGGIWSQGKR